MAKTLSDFMSNNGRIAPWRICNPKGAKIITLYCRLLYIVYNLMPKVTDVAYHPIIKSDHAPVSIDV